MDKAYAGTVRLLLAIVPDVFANDLFAMKGGTAINLVVRDMPRLSVDIDVVYLSWQAPRDAALQAIHRELAAIATRVAPLGVQTRLVRSKDPGDIKLIVDKERSQLKIEVNGVFRGTVLPAERRPLSARTSDLFGVELEVPILAPDELYAGKLVATLDRQHPRDLFDVCGNSTNRAESATAWSNASWSIWRGTTGRPMKCCSATTRTSPASTNGPLSA